MLYFRRKQYSLVNLKFYLLPFFCLFSYLSQAQIIEGGCIKINFENILDATPMTGLPIGDQYYESTGISFYLDSGELPVLAGIGPPLEAFISVWGDDTSSDDDILGNYMLTDNGILALNDLIPLNISFENPIDTMSAVVLDLDGDEYFDVIAYDEFGDILYEQRFSAGDPGTGDGIATPIGFNLPDCFGTIYSMKFEGQRNDGEGFGFAMDNFQFCFEGVDILEDLEVITTDVSCGDNLGKIEISNDETLSLMYSIDGNNFNATGIFTDLEVGDYLIIIEDQNGCQTELNETVVEIGAPEIEDVIITHTSCGENNGSFEVLSNHGIGTVYFINELEPSSSNVFSNLAAGTYPITIVDITGCITVVEVTINASQNLLINEVIGEDDDCQKRVGSISMAAMGANGDVLYSIDNGLNFQEESIFDSLSQGFYQLMIQDELLCTAKDSILIGETPGLSVGPVQVTGTICGTQSGIIQFTISGGTGDFMYQLNGEQVLDLSSFRDLDVGVYDIVITDEIGCIFDFSAEIGLPICPVYFPNIFSPISEDGNNRFKLYTLDGQDIQIVSYEIFDRWGSRIYSAYNFDIYSDDQWWEGQNAGINWSSGVYVYKVELEYYEGSREIFTGDVSLIR